MSVQNPPTKNMNTTVLPQNHKTQRPQPAGSGAKTVSLQSGQPALPALSLTGSTKSPIKVMLVDDHPIVRKGIGSCLSRRPNLSIVGEAGDGQEALRKAKELAPDIIMMDMDMPNMDGLAVTQALRREMPRVKVLVLSMYRHSDAVLRILQSGAVGYVLKDATPDELVLAIETVHAGQTFYSPDIARIALNQFVRGPGE